MRVSRWRDRFDTGGSLTDAKPGPDVALHGLLDWERQAIIEVYDQWAEIDRGYRKLAHRGSRLGAVYVSESSVYRVLNAEGLLIPAGPAREPGGAAKPWPDWVEYRANQVWVLVQWLCDRPCDRDISPCRFGRGRSTLEAREPHVVPTGPGRHEGGHHPGALRPPGAGMAGVGAGGRCPATEPAETEGATTVGGFPAKRLLPCVRCHLDVPAGRRVGG